MAFTLLTQNQAQITAQNDANIYRMLSMGEDLTFVENIKFEFSASQVGIKEGYYLVCGRLIKAENTIISIPSTKGVYRLCLRVKPSASAIADRVKLILLDSTQSRSTTDINGDTASGIYDALLADFDTVTMRFTQRIRYAGVPLIDRVPTATKNSKGTVIAGQNLSIDNQGVLNVVIPKAKASTLGGVKVGNGLSITDDGTLSANVQAISPANAFHLGGVKIGANINFTSDGTISTHAPYSLPTASKAVKGGVKVGSGLKINNDGTLNAINNDDYKEAIVTVNGTTLEITVTTNKFTFSSIEYLNTATSIKFMIAAYGSIVVVNDVIANDGAHLALNGVLTDEFKSLIINNKIICCDVAYENNQAVGVIVTNVGTIPCIASDTQIGGIKVGDGLKIDDDGILSADVHEIPVASVTTLGGVKVGDGLNITNSGSLFSRVSGVVVKEQEEGCEIVSFDNVVEQKAFTEADITNGYYVYSAGNIYGYSFSIASTDENISDYIDGLNVVAFESLSNMSNPVSIDYRTRSTKLSDIRDYLVSIGEDTSDYEGTSYIYFDFPKVPSNCNVIAIEANSVNTLITQTTSSPISILKSTQNGGAKPYVHYVTSKIIDSIKYNVPSASASGVETRTCEISDNTARAFINKFTTDSNGNLYFNGKKVVLES